MVVQPKIGAWRFQLKQFAQSQWKPFSRRAGSSRYIEKELTPLLR
jgi:hypothetical protein